MKIFSFMIAIPSLYSFAVGAPAKVSIETCGTSMDTQRAIAAEAHFQLNQAPLSNDTLLISPAIPVYIHVIAADKTAKGGWVTDAQIHAQVSVLNQDFAKSGVRWSLVRINRVINKDLFANVLNNNQQESMMKTRYRQGGPGSLNVYTVSLAKKPTLLGFATFPVGYQSNPKDDGIVLKYSTLPGGSNKNHNLGRTLTHEAGHWVGLYHTFQGGCFGPGDYISDTPAEASEAFGCPKFRNTCKASGYDPTNNFMDYTDDSCKTGFTTGQGARMRSQLRTYRGINV